MGAASAAKGFPGKSTSQLKRLSPKTVAYRSFGVPPKEED
jgi:hypothetical protein